jgi:hypothetical protein
LVSHEAQFTYWEPSLKSAADQQEIPPVSNAVTFSPPKVRATALSPTVILRINKSAKAKETMNLTTEFFMAG